MKKLIYSLLFVMLGVILIAPNSLKIDASVGGENEVIDIKALPDGDYTVIYLSEDHTYDLEFYHDDYKWSSFAYLNKLLNFNSNFLLSTSDNNVFKMRIVDHEMIDISNGDNNNPPYEPKKPIEIHSISELDDGYYKLFFGEMIVDIFDIFSNHYYISSELITTEYLYEVDYLEFTMQIEYGRLVDLSRWEYDDPFFSNDPIEYIYVGDDYSILPLPLNDFYLIEEIELLDLNSNTYSLILNSPYLKYKFDVSFPSEFNINDFKKNDGSYNISYTENDGDRLLYLQPDLSLEPYPAIVSSFDNRSDLLVGFATINLTKKTYDIIEKLELSTIVNKENNKNAFMYFFFPMEIEKILSVDISYDYRLIHFFGLKKDDWQTERNIYLWDEESEIKPSYWWLTAYFILDWLDVYNIDTIQEIHYLEIPDNVKNDYKNLLNGDIIDLHNLSLYKVHLGQFKKIGSTSYDIVNTSVINIVYMQDGVIYDVPYDLIDQENIEPPEEITPIEKIKDSVESLGDYGFVIYYLGIGFVFVLILAIVLRIINFVFSLLGLKRK